MLLLKHIRDWSFAELEREVRGNLLYREFTHIGAEKVPDAKTLARLAQALGPEVIEKLPAGSAKDKSGEPVAKDESAYSNAGTDCVDAVTKETLE